MKKKRALTLLEVMIVILLIALITGVIGYNMKGALDKGRAFKTERAQEQLRDLLLYRAMDLRIPLEELLKRNLKTELDQTGLTKNSTELLKDGWGEDFEIKLSRDRKDVTIISQRKIDYDKKTRPKNAVQDELDDE